MINHLATVTKTFTIKYILKKKLYKLTSKAYIIKIVMCTLHYINSHPTHVFPKNINNITQTPLTNKPLIVKSSNNIC